MSQLRSSILAESDRLATKSRFGMFSIPPPIGLGDDSPYKQITHPRGQDGKPVTKPRNLLPGANRSGMGKKGYFTVPESIYQGDKYQDPFKKQLQYERKIHSKGQQHQTDFKPASTYKILAKSAYEYVEQKPLQQKKIKRDQNGRVWTQPKNITTNTTSKVQRTFMKNPEYVPDPYERKKEYEIQQKKIWKSKLPEANWKFTASSIGTFSKNKQTYGIDDQAKSLMEKRKQQRKMILKTVAHDSSFIPAKKVGSETIGKYPTAMSAQSMQTLKVRSKTEKSQQQTWRPNDGLTKTKASPSISLNRKNIHIRRYK